MDILSLFLINERDRLKSSQKNHDSNSFMLWKKELEEQKNYERRERVRSVSYQQKDKDSD